MDPEFHQAIAAIVTGDLNVLRSVIAADPGLPARRSSCGHPTLLQMVAVEAANLPDVLGAARVLVDAGAPLGEPLVATASVDSREVLLFLLDRGIDVDGDAPWTPLDEATYWCHLELAQILVERGATIGSLRVAAGLGRMDAVRAFFDDGRLRSDAGPILSQFPDTIPDGRDNDPADVVDNAFVMAAGNGWQNVAAFLHDRCARVNAIPPGFHWKGTALHAAVWRGHRSIVEWLLSIGADPTIRDDLVGSDAAGWARHHGHHGLAALLAS